MAVDFKSIWNSVVVQDDLPDLIASLTVESLNDVLKVHRNKGDDRNYYRREEKFVDQAGAALFTAEVIVGGSRQVHANRTAKSLKIELLDTAPLAAEDDEFTYDYPSGLRLAPAVTNAMITAEDVNFYFSWPSSTGGPAWSTHLPGIQFKMEVALRQIEITSDDGKTQQALEVTPIKLRVSKAAATAIRGHIGQNNEQKIQDLFFALLNYIALSVGPNLAQVIKFPILAIDDYTVLPMLFRVTKKAVTLGAKLNLADRAEELEGRLKGLEERFWAEVDADLYEARASGVLERNEEIEFPRAMAYAKSYRASLRTERNVRGVPNEDSPESNSAAVDNGRQDGAASVAAVPDAEIGVAINEYLLDTIVSKFGNINKQGSTKWKTLVAIRGRLGYELRVGRIDIKVDGSGITGATPINAFGGVYYQLKEVEKCSWSWGSERKLGLGVKGTPKITLRTRPTNGLSVLANFELGGLSFYTGAGFPIDDIVKALSKPLMEIVEGILDTIALGISFVVIPVQIKMPDQATVVNFSRFVTSQHAIPGAGNSARNNYAVFTSQTTAA